MRSQMTLGTLASFTRKTHNYVRAQDKDGRGLATPVLVMSAYTVTKLVTEKYHTFFLTDTGAYTALVSIRKNVWYVPPAG